MIISCMTEWNTFLQIVNKKVECTTGHVWLLVTEMECLMIVWVGKKYDDLI